MGQSYQKHYYNYQKKILPHEMQYLEGIAPWSSIHSALIHEHYVNCSQRGDLELRIYKTLLTDNSFLYAEIY